MNTVLQYGVTWHMWLSSTVTLVWGQRRATTSFAFNCTVNTIFSLSLYSLGAYYFKRPQTPATIGGPALIRGPALNISLKFSAPLSENCVRASKLFCKAV